MPVFRTALFIDPALQASHRFHVMRMMFVGRTTAFDVHDVGLNFEFIGGYLHEAGFRDIQRVADFGLFEDANTLGFANVPISLNVQSLK